MSEKEKATEELSFRERLRKKEKKLKEKGEGFWADFKKFITKGNVLDLAVAVVIASAFNAIVNGLVKYIITPFITYFTSGVSIDEWEYVLKEAVVVDGVETAAKISIQYGLWIQAIVDFLIIAFSIFVAVRIIKGAEKRLKAKELAEAEAAAAKKKAEEDQKAAESKAAAELAAAALKEREDAFYANVAKQTELLEAILSETKK